MRSLELSGNLLEGCRDLRKCLRFERGKTMAMSLKGLVATPVNITENHEGTLVELFLGVGMEHRGPVLVSEMFMRGEGKRQAIAVTSRNLEELATMLKEAAKVLRIREEVMGLPLGES